MQNEFETNLAKFVAAVTESFLACNRESNYEHYLPATTEAGPRFVRVVRETPHGGGRSVFCFVEKATGNVLKAEGWSRPAKAYRGFNIHSPESYVGKIDTYGRFLYAR